MMKKLLSLMLCLMAVLAAFGGAMAEAAELNGAWYLTGVELQGMSLSPAMLGLEVTMTLNADGSAEMASLGVADAGTWMQEGNVLTVETGTVNRYTLMDGVLRSEEDAATGMVLVFTREQSAAFEAAPVRTDAALEEFNGEWHAFMIDVMGVQMAVTGEDTALWIEIEDGVGVMHSVENGLEDAIELKGSFADGVLQLGMMPLALHEDGRMSYSEAAEEGSVVVFFEKTA